MKSCSTLVLLLYCCQMTFGALTLSNRPRKLASELLLPVNSTTALMCEPVFTGDHSMAKWYRDGKVVATVASDKNAVYDRREHVPEQPMPNVGFLIISNVQKEDEGEYWCRKNNGDAGEVFKVKVAFVDPIEMGKTITVEPVTPSLGTPLLAHCPLPNAYPKPSVSWLLDREPISASSSDSVIYPNGSLFLPRLSALQLGRLECIVSNFAGRASSHIQLQAAKMSPENPSFFTSSRCAAMFRSSILWFLLGCLVTSSAVLIYLLCVLVLLRPNQPRLTLRPSMWLRSHPLLGPGFRKAVVPTPDYLVPPRPTV